MKTKKPAPRGSWRSSPANGAAKVTSFITGALYHCVGSFAGQPFELMPWQRNDIIRPLFGTLLPDGRRQYRTALLELPRKNGKSALAAAVALYMLLMDDEPGAHVYSCAADRDQARVVFSGAVKMLEASPEIQAAFAPRVFRDVIEIPSTGSLYRVLSSDVPTKHGLNPSAVLFDELHAQPNRELWDVMTTAQGTRRQPLTLAITTAGFDRHSIAFELHRYAEQVRAGIIKDPTFFSKAYGAADDADWTDRAVWQMANPALGDFLSREFLEQEYTQAAALPARQNTFRRLYLNQWTEQADRWLDLAAWDACSTWIGVEALKGRECYAGLDLASTRDVTALVLVFPDEDGGFDVLPYFWVPADTVGERVKRDRVPYDEWAREGFLRTTPGSVCDYDVVREHIRELAEEYDLREIAYDRWGATPLVTALQADGATCIPLGQGFASMSAPTKELEKLVVSRNVRHGGNPVLRWMAANVAVEQDPAGNLKPSKRKSSEKIDGIVALVMALDRVSRHSMGRSVYEDRGIFTL